MSRDTLFLRSPVGRNLLASVGLAVADMVRIFVNEACKQHIFFCDDTAMLITIKRNCSVAKCFPSERTWPLLAITLPVPPFVCLRCFHEAPSTTKKITLESDPEQNGSK